MTYADQINEVEALVRKLQSCTDVDEALQMFEKGIACLEFCEQRIASARGRFSEIVNKAEATKVDSGSAEASGV